jgi:hypothetical protein
VQDAIVRFVTDVQLEVEAFMWMADGVGLTEEQRSDVLALRGLLACGILEHSLQLRHLVDYGVNRCVGMRAYVLLGCLPGACVYAWWFAVSHVPTVSKHVHCC